MNCTQHKATRKLRVKAEAHMGHSEMMVIKCLFFLTDQTAFESDSGGGGTRDYITLD